MKQIGVEYYGISEKDDSVTHFNVGTPLIIGNFKRGRTDKPMKVTVDNIRSVLGYQPKNKDYQRVLDYLNSFEIDFVNVLKVYTKYIGLVDINTTWYSEKLFPVQRGTVKIPFNSDCFYQIKDGFTNLDQVREYLKNSDIGIKWQGGKAPLGSSGDGLPNPNTNIAVKSGRAIIAKYNFNLDLTKYNISDATINIISDDGCIFLLNGKEYELENNNSSDSSYINPIITVSNKNFNNGNNEIILVAVDSVPFGNPGRIYLSLDLSLDTTLIEGINPIHVIRECLTNTEYGLGKNVDDESFKLCANRAFNQFITTSRTFDAQNDISGYMYDLLNKINAELYDENGKVAIRFRG